MAGAGASDVVVIGAGAWGLWAARACLARGMSVTVVEAGGPRASETPVGALAPHAPDRWSAMAEWQFRALLGWEAEAAALEAESGVAVGYARVGRLVGLGSEAERARAEGMVAAAEVWGGAARMEVVEGRAGWLTAPFGALRDDLTGRVDGKRMLAALRAAVGPRVRWVEGRFLGWEGGAARLERGEVRAGAAILATGWEGLRGLGLGGPEHGQAARLRVRAPEGAEVLAGPGLWVVPHADGTVGVGTTAERGREDLETDGALEDVLVRARALCPALGGAEVLERWAGLRPRPDGRRPALGPVPGAPGLIAALGGWRIGLGLAPAAGQAAAAFAAGERPELPEGLAPGGAAGT